MELREHGFPVLADIKYTSSTAEVIEKKVAPKDFFAPLLEIEQALALGIDSGAYRGSKHWLFCMSSINVNQPYARNSFLNFFIMDYSVKKSRRWLNTFTRLPKPSLEYFERRCFFMYRSWLALSISSGLDLFSTRSIEVDLQKEGCVYSSTEEAEINSILRHYLGRKSILDLPEDVILYDIVFGFITGLQSVFGPDIEEFIDEYISFIKTFLSKIDKMQSYSKDTLVSLLKFIYSRMINDPRALELDAGYSIDDR
jgi:hypothetical protein